jgi:hypothetical protein
MYKLPWAEFYKSEGFNCEKMGSLSPSPGDDALYTFRVTDSVRGLAYREGNYMQILCIEPDQDAAYRKKGRLIINRPFHSSDT